MRVDDGVGHRLSGGEHDGARDAPRNGRGSRIDIGRDSRIRVQIGDDSLEGCGDRRHSDRLVGPLPGVLIGVGEPGQRLARHRGRQCFLPRGARSLGRDQRRHPLGLGGVVGGGDGVGGDSVAARLIDTHRHATQQTSQGDHHGCQDRGEHRVACDVDGVRGRPAELGQPGDRIQDRDQGRPRDLQRKAEGEHRRGGAHVEQIPDPGRTVRGIRTSVGDEGPAEQDDREDDREDPGDRAHPHAGDGCRDHHGERNEDDKQKRQVRGRCLLPRAQRIEKGLRAQQRAPQGGDDADDPLHPRLCEPLRTRGDVAEGTANRRVDGDRQGLSRHRGSLRRGRA